MRALNVGGTNVLPMAELRALVVASGFDDVRTYIASGNAIFTSERTEDAIVAALRNALAAKLGKPVALAIRTRDELAAVVGANPFADVDPARVGIVFAPRAIARSLPGDVRGRTNEELRVHGRELFVAYPDGIGRSKLRFPPPLRDEGTTRNVATVAKIVDLIDRA